MYYEVKTWRGGTYPMTAKELYERVMYDCKSNYDWVASATELVRICDEPGFPQEYARGIKNAILNCFAEAESDLHEEVHQESTDDAAVHSCYNSLSSTDEEARTVKQKYLKAIIGSLADYSELPIHTGSAFFTFRKTWQEAKLDEYCAQETIDFALFFKESRADFRQKLEAAEKQGIFAADDEAHSKRMTDAMRALIRQTMPK